MHVYLSKFRSACCLLYFIYLVLTAVKTSRQAKVYSYKHLTKNTDST